MIITSRIPTEYENPPQPYQQWINSTDGELFVCIDNTRDANVWVGQSGSSVGSVAGLDPFYSDVALSLSFNDELDHSVNGLHPTFTGDTYVKTVNPSLLSNYLYSANSGFFSCNSNPSVLDVGTGDFTAELWVNLISDDSGYRDIFMFSTTSLAAGIKTGDSGFANRLQVSLDFATIGSVYNVDLTATDISGRWTHLAFVRDSSSCSFFINGVAQLLASGTGSTYSSSSFVAATSLTGTNNIYGGYSVDGSYSGMIKDVRFTKAARYTDDFTPPILIV